MLRIPTMSSSIQSHREHSREDIEKVEIISDASIRHVDNPNANTSSPPTLADPQSERMSTQTILAFIVRTILNEELCP